MNGDDLKKEYGDYQTPQDFSDRICEYLCNGLDIDPEVVIEPTCGVGNFLNASLKTFRNINSAFGIEINEEYCEFVRTTLIDDRIKIFNANFFEFDLKSISTDKNLLVIGNPPWATNSDLNFNLPEKENFKKLSGTDAITGASNFDICEYIILKLVDFCKNKKSVLAMLCKTSVARNVFEQISKNKVAIDYAKMITFDSNKIFGISASACCFILKFSDASFVEPVCDCCDIDNPDVIVSRMKMENGMLKSVVEGVDDLFGDCQLVWRQGVKHDCSSIMELRNLGDSKFENKRKEVVELEDAIVFPLLKSSDFKKCIIDKDFKRSVIVTQKKAREETAFIAELAPKTWNYLNSNIQEFRKRKSSIYNGAPDFSMFGVGDYSYSKYKVGLSGFYKKPLFGLIYNKNNLQKPIMLDDTSYFLSFDNFELAYSCMLLLNSQKVQEFLLSISFKDAKRPYTKKVLQKIDLIKAIDLVSFLDMKETEHSLLLEDTLKEADYGKFKSFLYQFSSRTSSLI